MFTEELVLVVLKKCEHGTNFINTSNQILETIVERVWFEDLEGAMVIEKIAFVINHYINFELRDAIRVYDNLKDELKTFISSVCDKEDTMIRVNTWLKIAKILEYLEEYGKRFLVIAETELERLNKIP